MKYIIFILLFCQSAVAQNYHERINKAAQLKIKNRNLATQELQQLLTQNEILNNDSLKAEIYFHLQWIYAFDGNEDSTLIHFNNIQEYSNAISSSRPIESFAHMGDHYLTVHNYDKALIWYLKTDSISNVLETESQVGNIKIGELYLYTKQPTKAYPYLKKALDVTRNIEHDDKNYNYLITFNLMLLRDCLNLLDDNSESIKNELIEMVYGNPQLVKESFHHTFFTSEGKEIELLKDYLKRPIRDSLDHQGIRNTLLNQLMKEKRYNEVIEISDPKLLNKGSTGGFHNLDELSTLSLAFNKIGQLDSAYHYANILNKLQKEKYKDQSISNLDEIHVKYDVALKEKESLEKTIALEKIKRNRNIWILGLGCFGGLALFYFYNRSRWKDQLHNSELVQLGKEKEVEVLQSLIEGQERERSRIAKDLHDSLGSILSLTKAEISTKNNREEVMKLVDHTASEVRRISHNMMPSALEDSDFISAVEDLVSEINTRTNLTALFNTNKQDVAIDKHRSIILYRILEELTTNTLKHADATNLIIELMVTDDQLSINFEDDGKGFNVNEVEGFGINTIKSRIDILNGQLDIASYISQGTSITITIPTE